ncbi:LytR/AlgR family response regulator transcription factor [Maribacter sp. ACAM166]|uniref:LytR/AlgR family response regulator transcription factor n=1 Tax=Maribacter sp. ACAM166 TaxID=2508996 RepID=UPI0010FD2A28|nr:LytTR family DNA-binding domain-containing protein [Maribacter sp. ACAM166]TLP82808.1 response regulator transcription factor [Maribacter sp. ACAM166]
MKIVIVEDELAASDNLTYLLHSIDPSIEILAIFDTVKAAVAYFSTAHDAELVLMDIHLADGISFEIFEQVKIDIPVVFTTAYDQYALKAFKVNSIDYLLKPIDEDELTDALNQFTVQVKEKLQGIDDDQLKGLLSLIKGSADKKGYKNTFLVSQRDQLIPLKTATIAYFLINLGAVKAVSKDNQTYSVEGKLEDIEESLDPTSFYRANRQCIVNREAIVNLKYYFNGKLIVSVNPVSKERIIVSKAKASDFKDWMNS